MNVILSEIKDAGSLEHERIVIKVQDDCNIGDYLILISRYVDTKTKRVSINAKAPYWFPDRQVKKNDYVVVYTKLGNNTDKVNSDGTTSFFFYRGLQNADFVDRNSCAVLLSVAQWGSLGLEGA